MPEQADYRTTLKTIRFDVVERHDVPQAEIDRIAHRTWRALAGEVAGSCESPRWVNTGPVPDADAYLMHRYEGTVPDARHPG